MTTADLTHFLEHQDDERGDEELLYGIGTLVIAYSKWIPVKRFVEHLGHEMIKKGVKVVMLDAQSSHETTRRLGIRVLPTFIFFGADGPKWRIGATNVVNLCELCEIAGGSE